MDLPEPTILPGPDAAPFWRAAQHHELVLPYCVPCDEAFFYPRTFCPRCGSRELEWRPASGRGVLHAFCIHYQASGSTGTPAITVLVDLEEGPRVMSYLVDVDDLDGVSCDMKLAVRFVDLPDGQSLPVFAPA